MMEGQGKERSMKPFQWPSQPQPEAPSLLWKLKDCFSTNETKTTTSPHRTSPQSDCMENRKAVLELKDVPPPPCHTPSSQSFSLPRLSLPSPCLLPPPPPHQLTQDSHRLQQPPSLQKQEVDGPTVSMCTHCSPGGCRLNSSVPLYMIQASRGVPVSVASTVYQSKPNVSYSSSGGEVLDSYKPQVSSSVTTSQPCSSDPYLPHYSGLQHTYPLVALQQSLHPSSLPSASSFPVSLHDSCLGSSGLYTCGGDCSPSARRSQGNALSDHTANTTVTSTAHHFANPMHVHAQCTVSVKGAHNYRECCLKPLNGRISESDQGWPKVPLPPTASIPIPLCNGCGTSSEGFVCMSSTSVSKTGPKYGSHESSGPENIPPVGVFWDIENCSVPSGRSAAAVVQRIRSRFFQGHREAEFICVCDISKENKAVIQELNNCQVTVAHINATAKNAADDKLRQCLRRFAETHTAPATVVLVSSDVNFASELSDLRHRHGFQVILVHGNYTSSALLQHAHTHVTFQEVTANLPIRMTPKVQPSFNLLYVYNLPFIIDKRQRNAVKVRLRRLSDNCGGRVLSLSQGMAVLSFSSPEAAARASKRMENEDVFGHRISLSFFPRPKPEFAPRPHHLPPPRVYHTQEPVQTPPQFVPSFSYLPLVNLRSPRRPRRRARLSVYTPERPYSPRRGCSGPPGGAPAKPRQEAGTSEDRVRLVLSHLEKGNNASSVHQSNGETGMQEPPPKSGLVGKPIHRNRDGSSPRKISESSVERGERKAADFQMSTPSAFNKLNLQRSFSPLVLSQSSWSSRSASPCLSSRSSPLLATPRSPKDSLQPFSGGAEIQVSNLDYRMSRKDLQRILHDTFSRHGQVKSLELSPHTDYQLKATVQMSSLQQAISAVSGLHRYKIGCKRIHVSLITGGCNKSLALFSTEIICILQDAPANCLPLFKFTEIYEKKYSRKLMVNDLYRLPELVAVREQGGSRLVCLLSTSQIRQSPLGSSLSQDCSSSASGSPVVFQELEYHEPVCRDHYAQQDFSEADFDPDSYKIPFVKTSLSTLASEVHSLLQSHEGTLPLLSFPDCYAAQFCPMQLVSESLDGGIPLEHLITCVPSITIVTAQNGFKVIKWIHNKPPAQNSEPWVYHCKSPVGNPQLIQFSREIIDLLRSQPSCLMPISKFIPSYHHHFAKQCRVSDYGFSKLLDLLEAVPHVLQILGMGTKRLLTLTHRAQVKRFTQDLLKLLKFQASKQVAIRDFMQAYHWCFSRDWRVTDYGVCDLKDLLTEIPDTTITITDQASDMVISVPKRERTVEEMERTKQFGKEVVDLLRHQPHCRMLFSKFIPTYHHHFGRQCKLSYYGFTKLMDLFEAIPDILMVLECGEEKLLTLTEVEQIKALAAQLVKLLRAQKSSSLPVSQLLPEYSKTFGYGLRLQDYDANSLLALLHKLCHVVKVVDGSEGREVQLINRKSLRLLTSQLLSLLMSQEEDQVSEGLQVDELSHRYKCVHGSLLNPCEYGFLSLSELLKSLPYLVELYLKECDVNGETGTSTSSSGHGMEWVRLTRLYQFARHVRALLHTYHYNQIFMTEFQGAYGKFVGRSLEPRFYGHTSTDELLNAIPQVVWIKGHGQKRIIVLKNDMKAKPSCSLPNSPRPGGEFTDSPRDSPISTSTSEAQSSGGDIASDSELLYLNTHEDLLCGPVPSCLPSPQLHPDPVVPQQNDLIHFEEKSLPRSTSSESDEPQTSEDNVSDHHEEQSSSEFSILKSPPTSTVNSPNRRTSRSRIRLAANFSFTAAP
ncbi:meiosis regulator and mRNA stability factor 1 isoform X1 [Gouania willdenowi]|uniref:Meiosis regulator and mRNA stability factor 1 n=1 Tax=Gouania willdenowi TaxID=441366 RepID=A0A8C5E917_GOUWI|nr:meiosis regulator and mRNA stability factor 1 isoform X1 [Gouania willdenowi]